MTPTEKLHEILAEKGFPITLWKPTLGHWRKVDVYKWEAWARHEGEDVHIYSWDSITRCANKGIAIHKES